MTIAQLSQRVFVSGTMLRRRHVAPVDRADLQIGGRLTKQAEKFVIAQRMLPSISQKNTPIRFASARRLARASLLRAASASRSQRALAARKAPLSAAIRAPTTTNSTSLAISSGSAGIQDPVGVSR